MVANKKKSLMQALILHFFIFYAVYFATFTPVLNYYPWLHSLSLENWVVYIIKLSIRVIIWAVPVLYLLKRYEKEIPIPLKTLFLSKPHLANVYYSSIALCLYVVIVYFLASGNLSTQYNSINEFLANRITYFTSTDFLYFFIYVAFCEELVFRGWIQNAFLSRLKPFYAMLITNVLFVLIHFPTYIFVYKNCPYNVLEWVGVFLIGMFFSYSFYKNKNIFIPILFHTIWDTIIANFYS